jgi:hypothetical protein
MSLLECQHRGIAGAGADEASTNAANDRRRPSSFTAEERRAFAKAPDAIVLFLGDLLPRIPTHYLAMGLHDEQLELRFPLEEMLNQLAHGRGATRLSTIAALCPQLFENPIAPAEDIEVPLPLEKLVDQIGWLHACQSHRRRTL